MRSKSLSASSIRKYQTCPLQYYYHYHTDKSENDMLDNDALHIGSIIHKFFEETKGHFRKGEISQVLSEINMQYKDYTMSDGEFDKWIEHLKRWHSTRDVIKEEEEINVEQEFSVPIRDFKIHGYVDMIENLDKDHVRIRDFKTGHRFKSTKDTQDSLQLKMYSLGVMELYDVDNVEVAYDQLRHESPEFVQYTKTQLRDFLKYLINLDEKIEKDSDASPNPGSHCGYCNYNHICRYVNEEIDIDEIEDFSKEEIIELYQQINGKLKVVKNKKEMVKEIVLGKMNKEDKDELEGETGSIRMIQPRREYYKPSVLLEHIDEIKNVDDVLKVKKSNVEELDEDIVSKLEETADISYSNPYIRINTS